MMSISVHPILPSSVVSQKHYFPSLKTAFGVRHTVSSPHKTRVTKMHTLKPAGVTASDVESPETAEEISGLELAEEFVQEPELPQVVGKGGRSIVKPRLVLKFIWMDKNIGLGLDQLQPSHGSVPLSPYFFWPRKDAWEELKAVLESKPWISQKKMIILLNQATDIINLWQQSGANMS